MISKRRKWVIAGAGVLIIATVAIVLLSRDDEPTYQGKTLHEWLMSYVNNFTYTNSIEFKQSNSALLAIGADAFPWLVQWIGYEEPGWRRALREWLPNGMTKLLDRDAYLRAERSAFAFKAYGTNAAPVVPDLEALMNDIQKPTRAMLALGFIGEPSVAVLTNALANPQQRHRPSLATAIGLVMLTSPDEQNTCAAVLLHCTNDPDPVMQSAARATLKNCAPEVLTNAPPQ